MHHKEEDLLAINKGLQMRNEHLLEHVELLEGVLNTMQEAIVVLDKDLRIRSANKAFYRIFNLAQQRVEGRLIHETGTGEWNVSRLRQLVDDIILNGTYLEGFELKHVFSGPGEKILMLKARRIVQLTHGGPLLFLAVEDLTGHKHIQKIMVEREAWFHELTDNVPVMIWVANTTKERLFFNKTWLNFTGRKVEDEVGSGWMEDIYPEDMDRVIETYNTSFDNRAVYKIDYRLRRGDGEYRWVQAVAKPIYEANGEFAGYLGTCSEIHDQHLMKEELEQRVKRRTRALQEANANLERSNSDLQQFAYVASHDLQEPLRKIITFSDRLQQRFKVHLPDDANIYIEKITSSAQRMTRLIDDLLNFSRVSRASEQFTDTDLNVILSKVLRDFDTVIGQRKIEMGFDKLPVIQAVPVQMTQLFHNLISNAIKFSADRETPKISVGCRQLSTDEVIAHPELKSTDVYFEITFVDNGIGFDQSFAEQIFIIFQRLHEKHNYPGTGIGLALCRKIVTYHHGIIQAVSKDNRGATFYVILPAKQSIK